MINAIRLYIFSLVNRGACSLLALYEKLLLIFSVSRNRANFMLILLSILPLVDYGIVYGSYAYIVKGISIVSYVSCIVFSFYEDVHNQLWYPEILILRGIVHSHPQNQISPINGLLDKFFLFSNAFYSLICFLRTWMYLILNDSSFHCYPVIVLILVTFYWTNIVRMTLSVQYHVYNEMTPTHLVRRSMIGHSIQWILIHFINYGLWRLVAYLIPLVGIETNPGPPSNPNQQNKVNVKKFIESKAEMDSRRKKVEIQKTKYLTTERRKKIVNVLRNENIAESVGNCNVAQGFLPALNLELGDETLGVLNQLVGMLQNMSGPAKGNAEVTKFEQVVQVAAKTMVGEAWDRLTASLENNKTRILTFCMRLVCGVLILMLFSNSKISGKIKLATVSTLLIISYIFEDGILRSALEKLRDYLSGPKAQAGGIDTTGFEGGLTLLVTTIMSAMAIPGGKEINWSKFISENIQTWSRSREGLLDICNMVKRGMQACADFFMENVMGTRAFKLFNTTLPFLDAWIDESRVIIGDYVTKTLLMRRETLLQVIDVKRRGYEVLEDLLKMKTFNHTYTIRSVLNDLDRIQSELEAEGFFSSGTRPESVAVCLNGSSGVGKSMSVKPIIHYILARIMEGESLERFLRDRDSAIFNRTIENVYWEGYNGQFVVLYDDFGQTLSANATAINEFIEIIRAANNQPYHLHYASMLMKLEHYFTSKLIFVTTNIQDIEHTARNFVACPEAVERRINVWVTVTIKKEYCTEATKNKSIRERRLDQSKIKKGFDHTTYEFYENKRINGSVILGQKYDFMGLVQLIIDEYTRCQLKDVMVEQDVNDLVASALEDRGIAFDSKTGQVTSNEKVFFDASESYSDDLQTSSSRRSQGGIVSKNLENVEELINNNVDHVKRRIQDMDYVEIFRSIKFWFSDQNDKVRNKFHDDKDGYIHFMKDKFGFDNRIDLSYGVEDKFSDSWETLEELAFNEVRSAIAVKWAINRQEGVQDAFRKGIMIMSGPLKLNSIELESLSNLTFPHDWYQKWHCDMIDDVSREFDFESNLVERLSDFTPIDDTIVRTLCKVLACIFMPQPKGNDYSEYILIFHLAQELDIIYHRGCRDVSKTQALLQVLKTRTLSQLSQFKEKYPIFFVCTAVMGSIAGIFASYHIVKFISSLFIEHEQQIAAPESKQIASVNVAQGADPMLKPVMDKIIGKNLVAILHGPQLQCFAIFITGNEMILPEHVRKCLLEKMGDKTRPINIVNPHNCEVISNLLDEDIVTAKVYNANVDLCIMTVSNTRRFADVTGLFVDKACLKDRQRGTACLVQFEETMKGDNTMVKVYMPFKRMNSVSYMDKHRNIWVNHSALSYEGQTRSGDCGLPIFLVDPTTRCMKIIGIHIAGNPQDGLGFAAVVTQDMLVVKAQAQDGGHSRMVFIKKIDRPPGTNMKSSIKRSIFYNLLSPVATKPAHLRKFVHDRITIDPWSMAVAKYDKEPAKIPDSYEFVMREAIRGVFNCVPRHDNLFRLYTIEEVVLGVDGDKAFPSINRSTSPGYPYNTCPVPGFPGKTRFFGKAERMTMDNNNKHWRELHSKLMVQMDGLKKGERQEFYYTGSLKDERRPIEKVDLGKTRYFAAAPIDLCIIVNQLFAGFKAYCYDNKLKNPMCVGLNPYSLDWHNMTTELLLMSPHIFGLDYSEFDSSQKMTVLNWMGKYLIDAMGSTGELFNARTAVWLEFSNSKHVLRDMIYAWLGCNPSGNPLTTIINTIYGIFLLLFTWQILVVEVQEDVTLGMFWNYVVAKITGDDNLVAVNARFKDVYNRKTIIECLALYGIKATGETKSEGEIVPYNHITEVSYLKRSFRFDTDHNRWVAPLALETVLEIPSWTKKGAMEDMIPITNMELVLRELALHGRVVFDLYVVEIKKMLLNMCGYVPKTTSYDELLSEVLAADLRDYTHKFQSTGLSSFDEENTSEWDDPTLARM